MQRRPLARIGLALLAAVLAGLLAWYARSSGRAGGDQERPPAVQSGQPPGPSGAPGGGGPGGAIQTGGVPRPTSPAPATSRSVPIGSEVGQDELNRVKSGGAGAPTPPAGEEDPAGDASQTGPTPPPPSG